MMYTSPVTVGNVTIPNRIWLAPMAGVSDLPFRLLCRRQGAGLAAMEMISAKAVCYGNRATIGLMKTLPEEAPVSLQLFGHEPEFMAEAVRRIEDEPYDLLDINMGCPVPKITGNGEGSALMRDPGLIEQLVRSAADNTRRPVTVKLRLGFDEGHKNVLECARAAEAGGASAVAIHGRTREQMYSGKADWTLIGEAVKELSVPVIGNGDVTDGVSAKKLFDETGCAAVMVGRAARGNPWVFRKILGYLDQPERPEPARPDREELARMILRHGALAVEYKGELTAMREMRAHVAWYLSGFPGASKLRAEAGQLSSYRDLEVLVGKIFPPLD